MKTKEELNVIKEEVERLSEKLKELSEGELKLVSGGGYLPKNPEYPMDPIAYCTVYYDHQCTWTKETRGETCEHYINNPGCWCIWDRD